MKRIQNILAVLALLIMVSSCKKDEIPAKPEPSPFSVALENQNSLPKQGGVVNLVISAGSNGWWIEIPEDAKSWIVINRVFGSGNVTLPVTVKENSTETSRTASVKVNSTFGLPPVVIELKQN